MKRKRVVIVTGNQRVAQAIFNDVKAVFNDDVDIDIVYPSQIASLDAVEADAFLVTRWYNIGGLTDKVSSKSKVVRTTRTISESGYKKITQIPPGTNVLVVNDSEQSTSGVIELLMDLHLDGLTYVPYTAGHYDPSLKIAITPGESRYVPSYIENIIDIGNRHIDISTVLALCNVMDVNISEIAGSLMNYFNMLLCRDVISRQYRDTLSKSMYMNSILKHMEQGVLLTAPDGRIILSNGKMNELLRMQITENRDYVSAVFPEGTAARIANMDNDTLALNVNGREMLINHETLNFGDTINHNLYFFNDVTYIRRLERKSREESLQKGFVAKHSFDDIVHVSAVMDECIRRARLFSRSDKTVLIQGESGTGKELVAQSIHNASSRRNKPFVAVNCAALPESLLESELFGYERGAFTGARQSGKKGLFEQANGGTIFLDEIGDMPLALQSRLLRVLQEKQVMRVGADSIIDIDVRVIAATNQNLMAKMEEGIFRSDLYYRLNVLPCHIASLRDRREDIVPLFLSFIGQKSIPNDLAARLKSYNWPGNVRELENTAEYYTMMRDFDMPLPEHIQPQHTAAGALDSDDIAILSVLNNGYIGRSALKKKLEAMGISLSEYSIRKKLDVLQSRNYISRQLGRSGTRITDDGRDALRRRMGK